MEAAQWTPHKDHFVLPASFAPRHCFLALCVSLCHFSALGPFVLSTEMAGEVVMTKQERCEGEGRSKETRAPITQPHSPI